MLLLLSVQVRGGGDQTGVRVDAEELVAGAWQQTVPHHSILLCRHRKLTQEVNVMLQTLDYC